VNGVEITDLERLREPEHPAADPWGIVHVVAHDLSAHGIKSRFGSEADFGHAAVAAAGLLSALGVQPLVSDDEPPAGPDDKDVDLDAGPRSGGGGQCHWLQAFEDAIKFRHARAAGPCSDCNATPDKCEDHGRDLDLIGEYRRTARQVMRAAPYPLSSDPRVMAARDLLAEQHQPAAMPPGELRSLLARCQRRLRGMLDAVGVAGPEAGS
jgi:hypothetical protein